jgi:predicted lipoprotein with Yx(FWY)xxD motif
MKKNLLILGIVIFIVACLAGCATTPPTSTPTPTPTTTTPVTPIPTTTLPPGYVTVNLTSNSDVGTYLTDAEGFALYYFGLDVPGNGTTACTSSTCLANWARFDAGTIAVNPPLQAADFGTFSADGVNQTTYRGWPLYTFKGDTSAGQFNGEGFVGVWFVMKPDYSVVIMKNDKVGSYLADGIGNTLYNFSIDSSDTSACMNNTSVLIQGKTCLQLWPPFSLSSVVVPSTLNASDFTTFTRSDGLRQAAYQGMPLYYFLVDNAPSQTSGQGITGFGGTWYVVSPSAVSVNPTSLPTTTMPLTTTQSSGGGSGY